MKVITRKCLPYAEHGESLVIPQVTPEKCEGLVDIAVADSLDLSDEGLQSAGVYHLNPKVIVSSSAERNTKGRSRILPVKVQLGYASLTKDETGAIVANPSRSGSEIEIHMVISLPRACAQDAINTLDSTARDGAYAQIAAAISLFNKMLDQSIGACGRHWQLGEADATSSLDTISLENYMSSAVDAGDGVLSLKNDSRSAGGVFDGGIRISLPATRSSLGSRDGTLRRGIEGLTPLRAEVDIDNPLPYGTARGLESSAPSDVGD